MKKVIFYDKQMNKVCEDFYSGPIEDIKITKTSLHRTEYIKMCEEDCVIDHIIPFKYYKIEDVEDAQTFFDKL